MAILRKKQIDIGKLIERSEAARETLAEARIELKHKFAVAARMKEAITSDPAKIVGGSVVGGYILKKIFFRKSKRPERGRQERISHLKKERGFLLGLFALIAALAKPAAKMYAGKLLKDYLGRRFQTGSSGTPREFRGGYY